jgi:hypothetical protein
MTDALFDVPISSADAAATQVTARPPGDSVGGQQSFPPLPTAEIDNAAPGVAQVRRGRGRPVGAGGYSLEDMRLLPDIQAQLVPTPTVETLRDAVRGLEPRINGAGSPLSRIRRVERLYREFVST